MAELAFTTARLRVVRLQDLTLERFESPEVHKEYVNGVRLPTEKDRDLRPRCIDNVAAIDFGTSCCSVAYCMKGDREVRLLKLDSQDVRVPTEILMDSDGKVVDFGRNARRRYAQLTKEKKQQHYFFSDIKMRLQHDKAGIASDDNDEITKLTLVTKEGGHFKSIPAKPMSVVTRPEELSLALEPEAAALHCINQCKSLGLPHADSSCYMVLDIGGGTVDITAHKVTDGHIEVILPPSGNDWGGKKINEKFRQFLGDTVGDPRFEKYLHASGSPDVAAKHFADLKLIIYQRFEDQKQMFGDQSASCNEALIMLPYSFMMTYKDDLERGVKLLNSPHVQLSDNELSISYQKMEEFFREAIEGIISCVSKCVREVQMKHTLDSVFFVGGFGGCKYLHDKVKASLDSCIKTYCPKDHKTAIVSGAVLFCQNSAIIKSRIADATYGTECSRTFDPSLHSREYLFYNDDREEKCNYLFLPFVLKGDVIHANKVLTTNYSPVKHHQSSMHFTIFTTLEKSMKYTRTPNGKILPEFHKIGELTVQMPDMTSDKERQVRLTFDFSHTEIHIEAYDITSNERVTTTVDFLSEMLR